MNPVRTLTVITGGGGGIGSATARVLLEADEAAGVVLLDRAPGAVPSILSAWPGRAWFFEVDVCDPNAVADAFAEIDGLGESLDGLVNAAGNVNATPSVDLTVAEWSSVMSAHVDSAFLCSQAAARRMIGGGGGAIVNIGSIAGLFGHPRRLPYSVAKAALHGMTRTLAVEWAQHGVRVNAVAPGYVQTPMVVEVVRLGLLDEEEAADLHAMKRLARPVEIARPIAFLLSDAASFITGEVLTVDGGFSVLKAQ